MATKKKMLQAAAGNAAAYGGGAGALNVEQVFSTYVYEGNGTSQIIENGINLGQSNGSGSINIDEGKVTTGTNTGFAYGTGDFTIEAWVRPEVDDGTLNSSNMYIFDHTDGSGGNLGGVSYYNGILRYYTPTGGPKDSTQAINNYEWAHIAVSRSSGTTRLFYNGAAVRTQTNDTYNYAEDQFVIGGFGGSNGYGWNGRMAEVRVSNIARYTSNFTAPTTGFTSDSNTIFLTGQGSTLVDNGPNSIGLTATSPATASGYGPFDADDAGEGGLVWIKNRDTTDWHALFDTERGVGIQLASNDPRANYTLSNALTSFNSAGFSLGNDTSAVNSNAEDYASWTFRKAPKFFDVVTYTGNGTAGRQISHNLGTEPGFIIVKRTDTGGDPYNYWRTAHIEGSTLTAMDLNTNSAASTTPWSLWSDSSTTTSAYAAAQQTSTYFTVGSHASINGSGGSFVAYLFAHNDGDGDFGPDGDADIIKCGSYTGTGASGNFVDLGFEPQWLMIKKTSNTGSWFILDNMRGLTMGNDVALYANTNAADGSPYDNVDPNPTGFTLKDATYPNASGSNYIYIAIRRGPMAVPTDATDVFAMDFPASSGAWTVSSGFPIDHVIYGERSGTNKWFNFDRVRGEVYTKPNLTSAEAPYQANFDRMDGIVFPTTTGDFSDYINYMWRRAPQFCDIVAYTGNGTRGHAINHNLAAVPEMIWCKNRDQPDRWICYHSAIGNDKKLTLDDTSAASGSDFAWWAKTDPTDQVFYLGESGKHNASGENHIAYLFASLDGVSKVGSFTGDGTSGRQIDCGFSNGARFILIKATSTTGGWLLWDAERGIVTGNDPYLFLSSTSAENTGGDNVDPYSAGFIVNGPGNNASGVDYIFYAIA